MPESKPKRIKSKGINFARYRHSCVRHTVCPQPPTKMVADTNGEEEKEDEEKEYLASKEDTVTRFKPRWSCSWFLTKWSFSFSSVTAYLVITGDYR